MDLGPLVFGVPEDVREAVRRDVPRIPNYTITVIMV
jgi:hypothetical protein